MDKSTKAIADTLGSIKNRCLIAEIVIERNEILLLPTLLEDIFENAQWLVDEFCVKTISPDGETL